jgi:glutamine cyclotransferase
MPTVPAPARLPVCRAGLASATLRRALAVVAGLVGSLVLATTAVHAQLAPPTPVVELHYEVVARYPHDPLAFTQGLLFRDGVLYESTGLHGRSSVRKVELATGTVLQQHDVGAVHFAEGLTDWNDRLVQLTWQSGVGFVYALDSFEPLRQFEYRGEGWGLARDDGHLIMSDGSAQLRFLDPETFAETRRLDVTYEGQPLRGLNELEMVEDRLYANVWPGDWIVIIDPGTGAVTGRVNLAGLLPADERARGVDVLNGIAWDAAGKRLFVTGKLWPSLFEIRLKPAPP